MFPKGQQKKKDTVVVMVDGKSPQTIPTMDSPPEPQKIPRCRLLVVLTIVLVFALVLLAGYCAWLFFSYETDILPFKQTHYPDVIIHPTKLSGDDNQVTTAPPKIIDDVFSQTSLHDNNIIFGNEDFGFSESSVESVYDSSEPYGSSESTFSSFPLSDDVVSSSYESESSSVKGSTKISDSFWRKWWTKRPGVRYNKPWDTERTGDYSSDDSGSYYIMPSYWIKRGNGNELPTDSDSDSSWTASSDSNSESWFQGSGDSDVLIDDPKWLDDYLTDFYSGLDDDDSSSEYGSGSSYSFYDVFNSFRGPIPQGVTAPPLIDRLPPERIEIPVCGWPSGIFGRHGTETSSRVGRLSDDVSCLISSTYSWTAIELNDGTSVVRGIKPDFDTYLIAIKIEFTTPKWTNAECYISYLPDALETEDKESGSGDGDYWDDEMEGSGTAEEDGIFPETVVIRNPILLGKEVPTLSESISNFCSTSTKFWASSLSSRRKPH